MGKPKTAQPSAAYAVEAQALSKSFGQRKVLDEVSFSLPVGSFCSIFGANGAGKTTLLRLLSTLMRPSSGKACVGGVDSREDPAAVRKRIGFVSHQSMLYPDLSAEENLAFYAELFGVPHPKKRAAELLEMVGLSHRRADVIRTFSRGMVQRVSIARALVNDPEIVFLDEPYSGLDPSGSEILDKLIAEAQSSNAKTEDDGGERKRSFVMVSHDLEKGFDACSHALVLNQGRVVCFASRDALSYSSFLELYRKTIGASLAKQAV